MHNWVFLSLSCKQYRYICVECTFFIKMAIILGSLFYTRAWMDDDDIYMEWIYYAGWLPSWFTFCTSNVLWLKGKTNKHFFHYFEYRTYAWRCLATINLQLLIHIWFDFRDHISSFSQRQLFDLFCARIQLMMKTNENLSWTKIVKETLLCWICADNNLFW